MNREELFKHHEELSQTALQIMKKKNHDYAGNSGAQPFANFERCEAMGICSTEQGFLVRITDKVSRLSTFANAGKLVVDNEGYQDAILDIMNYCVLFSAYIKSKDDA
jgi:predicted lipoprotein